MDQDRDPKPRPNHARYIEVLRAMTPGQRLAKAFELSAMSRELFREGLRRRFPEATPEELMEIELERIYGWRNPNSSSASSKSSIVPGYGVPSPLSLHQPSQWEEPGAQNDQALDARLHGPSVDPDPNGTK
jgi:hypothetical protein